MFAKFSRTPILKNICKRLLLYFHYNSHHRYHHHYIHDHCKMQLYRLRVLLTIPLDFNMILRLFQLNFALFPSAYIFIYRSSHRRCSVKKSVPRNFAKRPATLLKKRLCHRCFPVDFTKFLGTSFLQSTSRRLLLSQVLFQAFLFLLLVKRLRIVYNHQINFRCSVYTSVFILGRREGGLQRPSLFLEQNCFST